jgi:hypothetical protein
VHRAKSGDQQHGQEERSVDAPFHWLLLIQVPTQPLQKDKPSPPSKASP